MLDVKFVIHYQIGDKKDLQNIIYKKLVKKKTIFSYKKDYPLPVPKRSFSTKGTRREHTIVVLWVSICSPHTVDR